MKIISIMHYSQIALTVEALRWQQSTYPTMSALAIWSETDEHGQLNGFWSKDWQFGNDGNAYYVDCNAARHFQGKGLGI